jgi:hypothetical protein
MISLQTTDQFVTKMFETDPDFVFTVTTAENRKR